MKYTEISHSESFEFMEFGMHRWKKMGIKGELEEGDIPIDCHRKLREQVDAMKVETLTQLEEFRGTKVVDINPVDVTIQGIIEDIGNCTVLDEVNTLGVQTGLAAYLPMADKYPEIKAAYMKKFNEITNNQ